jgi:hypothetical protein
MLRIRRLRFARISGAFLSCTLASTIVFYSQHIYLGNYRDYPQHAFLSLAVFWITVDLLPPALLADWKFNSTFAVSIAIFLLVLLPALIISGHSRADLETARALNPAIVLSSYAPKTPVLVLSPSIGDAFPAVLQNHLVWASRFAHLWMLPAIVQNEVAADGGGPAPRKVLPPETVSKLAAMQRTDTATDLRKWKPEVVVVRKCTKRDPCYALESLTLNPLVWLLQSPAFAAEWANYHLQSARSNFDVYTRNR